MELYEDNHLLDQEKKETVKKQRKSFSHLVYKDARRIIALANKNWSKSLIRKETEISEGKIKRYLKIAKNIKTVPNLKHPWKELHKKTTYSIKDWENHKNKKKQTRAFNYGTNAVIICQSFIDFCQDLYKKGIFINGKLVKLKISKGVYKTIQKSFTWEKYPYKSWIYTMTKSENYTFSIKWVPCTKMKKYKNKSKHERHKPEKYNEIHLCTPKELLSQEPINYEIDSIIGKRTDKKTLLLLIDIHIGAFYVEI